MTPRCKNIFPRIRKSPSSCALSGRQTRPRPTTKSAIPSHHWFHYTDVPLADAEKYADGKAGRSQWDIVHMMRYCIAVLQGEEPEDNARKITKPIAVILLAHFVGDIHQPLHVGAQYFDAQGQSGQSRPGERDFPGRGRKLAPAQARRRRAPEAGSQAARLLGCRCGNGKPAAVPRHHAKGRTADEHGRRGKSPNGSSGEK